MDVLVGCFILVWAGVVAESGEGFGSDVHYINVTDFIDPYEVNITELLPFVTGKSEKIINGAEASRYQFPYQVALVIIGFFSTLFCGGSLISSTHILTAAHCITGFPERIIVILGTENLKVRTKESRRIDAIRYICHTQYSTWTLDNDICLLELKTPVEFNDAISPISLPNKRDARKEYTDRVGIVSGFGRKHDGGRVTPQLMYARVTVIDNYVCNRVIFKGPSRPKNICTMGRNHRGSCHGDSGGPLVIGNKQIGIVSFGGRSCTAGFPTVYTRVPKFIKWISYYTGIDFS